MMFSKRSVALFLLALGPSVSAEAGNLYVETGFGVSLIPNGSTLFGTSTSGSLGFAPNLTFAYNFMDAVEPFGIHLGVHARVATAYPSGSSSGVGMAVPYPLLRLEFSRFYIGGGYSPFVFTTTSDPYGFDYNREVGTDSFLAQVGLLWKVVPYFHFALEAAGQYVRTQDYSVASPAPTWEFSAQLRFIIGDPHGTSSGRSRSDYDGWRYPFGLGQ